MWDNVHIRHDTQIGHHCSIGGKSCIAYGVSIGDYVKINASVYICTGVEIQDGCMIAAGTVFTNDVFPRAMNRELTGLETSEPTSDTLRTRVEHGCTIGANATIGPGLTLGAYSMIGMGSTVTRDIPAHALAMGNPAQVTGYVCVCGPRLVSLEDAPAADSAIDCPRCGRSWRWSGSALSAVDTIA